MPVKWDDETEKKLLMAILHSFGSQLPTPNYNLIATLMGSEYTGDGIRQKYTKGLKKQAIAQFGEIEGDSNKSPVKTPAKRGGKKDADKDGDDDEKTPSKKVKVKEESTEGEDGEQV